MTIPSSPLNSEKEHLCISLILGQHKKYRMTDYTTDFITHENYRYDVILILEAHRSLADLDITPGIIIMT